MNEFLDQIWGIERLYIKNLDTIKLNPQCAAIILSCNAKNYDRFITLANFKNIVNDISIFGVQNLQISVINGIKNLEISKFETLGYLKILNDERIIDKDFYEIIYKFLDNLELVDSEIIFDKRRRSSKFKIELDNLNLVADELIKFDSSIKFLKEDVLNNKFTISITGVINSGKSSMLNAILNREILGTSNIPETANLTVLSYGDEEKAEVYYEDGAFEDIKLFDVQKFSSAKFEISDSVKYINLKLNNYLLKENIIIVDTPGLDDDVFKREELTMNFMKNSDAIIHLMNVSQSLTNKDIKFIKNIIKNTKNSTFIIALTHSDSISKSDLIEVLNYTKKNINAFLDDVSFFAIDSVSKNGINELVNFIFENFFGNESKKANLIIQNYKKALNLAILDKIQNIKTNLSNLNKSIVELNSQNINLENEIKSINLKHKNIKNDFDLALKSLDYSDLKFDISFKSGLIIIKDRIISDLKYNKIYNKNTDLDRIYFMFENGFKDLMSDVLRDFSYRIFKDIKNTALNLNIKLDDEYNFDVRNFLQDFTFKFDDIKISLKEVVNLDPLSANKILEDKFNDFINKLDLKEILNKLFIENTKKFKQTIEQKFQILENELKEKQILLQNIALSKNSQNQDEFLKINQFKDDLRSLEILQQRIN
ncbi:hypothetical protein F1B92_07595 [Campylobacter sp. FMV-PI01]|uniref:Dynamin N-terminal domain-containing protein n=1 Tax=Campylobacter portucalensis TaxID=2608384 RepID=A0A6L5WKU4_9BACT|nr:dynamin family protein [Campylobacter portucalensis]MSN97022.1 hypothetical protein [Campylobacter portucalensis]